MQRRHRRITARIASLAFVVLVSGCRAVVPTGASLPKAAEEHTARVTVLGEDLTVHVASPRVPASGPTPLVLYASGDGGWFGAAVGMFHTLASSGYYVAGFSTKALMHIEHKGSGPDVALVTAAYQEIIDGVRTQLALPPETPVVLTGWSRGAALGVLVASRQDDGARIAGVVAIGLAADERLEMEGDTDDDVDVSLPLAAPPSSDTRGRAIELYPLLARMAPRRAVVVQASGDSYLSAARARVLMGPDTAVARLVTIDAHNHRFDGGESGFATALVEAVRWVAGHGE